MKRLDISGRVKIGTNIRPEISKKNKYWISKNRYYELKHFCLQYPEWKRDYRSLDMSIRATSARIKREGINPTYGDPTAHMAEQLSDLSKRINLVESVAYDTAHDLDSYLLAAVTKGYTYEFLYTAMEIPCSKATYYELYRRFFWLLSKER